MEPLNSDGQRLLWILPAEGPDITRLTAINKCVGGGGGVLLACRACLCYTPRRVTVAHFATHLCPGSRFLLLVPPYSPHINPLPHLMVFQYTLLMLFQAVNGYGILAAAVAVDNNNICSFFSTGITSCERKVVDMAGLHGRQEVYCEKSPTMSSTNGKFTWAAKGVCCV